AGCSNHSIPTALAQTGATACGTFSTPVPGLEKGAYLAVPRIRDGLLECQQIEELQASVEQSGSQRGSHFAHQKNSRSNDCSRRRGVLRSDLGLLFKQVAIVGEEQIGEVGFEIGGRSDERIA